jgi:poly(3-hydroxybutyrate) depolymerase
MVPRLVLSALLVVCAATGCASGASSEPSRGCRSGSLPPAEAERRDVAGRDVLIDAPGGPADRALPLIVALHGFRSSPDDLRAGTRLGELARSGKAVVAYPTGHDDVVLLGTRGRGWDLRPEQTTDRDFITALLDRLEADRCIDRRRIYVTGFSNGGFAASLLGCQLARRLAAVASVAGALDLGDCKPERPVPILFLYGTSDRVVPVDIVRGGIDWWVTRNRCRASDVRAGCTRWAECAAAVVACEGPQEHRWPADATDTIWRFFETSQL